MISGLLIKGICKEMMDIVVKTGKYKITGAKILLLP